MPSRSPAVRRVLVPLPDRDVDPTEVAVPWQILTDAGIDVVFATEHGTPARTDPVMLTGAVLGRLGARREARLAHAELTEAAAFRRPLRWADVDPAEYSGLLLPGGHAPGMRQYLESERVQEIVLALWGRAVPVAAICHGPLVLARTVDPGTGRSVIAGRRVTSLPASLERTFIALVSWRRGRDYARTYPHYVEDEVRSALGPTGTYEEGPGRSVAFVVVDGNVITSRMPVDAEVMAQVLAHRVLDAPTAYPEGAPPARRPGGVLRVFRRTTGPRVISTNDYDLSSTGSTGAGRGWA